MDSFESMLYGIFNSAAAIKFRVNNGSKGVIDEILCYLDRMEGRKFK